MSDAMSASLAVAQRLKQLQHCLARTVVIPFAIFTHDRQQMLCARFGLSPTEQGLSQHVPGVMIIVVGRNCRLELRGGDGAVAVRVQRAPEAAHLLWRPARVAIYGRL